MAAFDKILDRIALESKRFLGMQNVNTLEDFRESVLENIFLKEMKYWELIPPIDRKKQEITVEQRIKIKVTLDEVQDKKATELLFKDRLNGQVKKSKNEWGILISPKGLWLLNNSVYDKSTEVFRNKKIVLEIIHGKNTDQKYFEFFSCENIIGDSPNTNYFRDIIEYKNRYYKGNEKSWRTYHSALKRFFKFYSKDIDYFKNEEVSVYDEIEQPDFVRYTRAEMKIEKESTLKNAFFYIKDFMNCMSDSRAFDISTKNITSKYPQIFEKTKKQNIMNELKLRKVIQCLGRGRNSKRDVVLFLMFMSFGFERRKICLMKWNQVIFLEDSKAILQFEGREVPMPQKLIEALKDLKSENISRYIFYRTKKNGDEPMRENAVNDIFSKLSNINPCDSFYQLLTPANIRRSVFKYLLEHGCPLEEVMYLMNIEIWNLGNYLSHEDIDYIVAARKESKSGEETNKNTCMRVHPMESFLEML